VNAFLSSKGSPTVLPKEVIPACAEAAAGRRATEEEKDSRLVPVNAGITMLESLHQARAEQSAAVLKQLQAAAVKNENMFDVLMEATKCCSLGQLTEAMFEVGGQYRRNM
jgi:methylmalonyl-CoA mutase